MQRWLDRVQAWTLPGREAVLTAGMLAAYLVLAPLACRLGCGRGAYGAAAIAAGVCWVSASTALALAEVFRGPALAFASLVLTTGARMALPLMVVLVIHQHGGLRGDMQVVYHFIVYYVAALAIQTPLSLPPQRRTPASGAARKAV